MGDSQGSGHRRIQDRLQMLYPGTIIGNNQLKTTISLLRKTLQNRKQRITAIERCDYHGEQIGMTHFELDYVAKTHAPSGIAVQY